jgi:hypothetical protein
MRRITMALAVCGAGWLGIGAFGFSSDGSALTRSFDRIVSPTNQPITVTATFTNGGTSALRGFFYTEQVPSGLAVTPLGVTLNGRAVTNYTFESGWDGDVYPGCTPCRWRLESPTRFAEANPISPQGVVQIVYTIAASAPGIFLFQEFTWAGFSPDTTNASFGFSEAADLQTAQFVKGILSVIADHQSRVYGAENPPLTASYSGFVDGDDANVLSGSPGLSTTAAPDSPPGTYPITVSQGTLVAPGYGLNFVNGALTVTWPPLRITAMELTNHTVTITWTSVPDQTYRVQYKNDLADADWLDLPPAVTAAGPTASKTDAVGAPQRFYRVVLPQAADETPVIQSPRWKDGVVTLTWSALAGRAYHVQVKDDPAGGTWTDLPPAVIATGPTASTTDTVGTLPQRFYRVRVAPTP